MIERERYIEENESFVMQNWMKGDDEMCLTRRRRRKERGKVFFSPIFFCIFFHTQPTFVSFDNYIHAMFYQMI